MARSTRGTRRAVFSTITLTTSSQIQHKYDQQLSFEIHKPIVYMFIILCHQELHLGLEDHLTLGFPDEKNKKEKRNQTLLNHPNMI